MPTLKRQRRKYRDRAVAFVPWPATGIRGILADALRQSPPTDVVYVVGPALGVADLRAMLADDPGPGWAALAHYVTLPAPVLRYAYADGHRVEIHRASSYFGAGNYTSTMAGQAWRTLGALVRSAFDEGYLLATPAATGRYLLARSIPGDREWPVLSDDTQEFLRATTGQGRIQMFGREGDAPLVQYDARLAYAAHCDALPCGEPTRDSSDEFAGWYTPARYRVRFAVPRRWDRECVCGMPGHAGVGILPVQVEGRWSWPSDPRASSVAWCDAREIAVALAHDWDVQIVERLIFPTPPYPAATRSNGQVTRTGPLDVWSRKLAALRRDPDGAADAQLVNVALRAILLYGIGALHGAPRRVTRTVSGAEARAGKIPAHATDVLPLGDRFVWTETEHHAWPEMSHPEWTSTIWARARIALLTSYVGNGRSVGMLNVPAENVVACFTDSIYLTDDPHWPDDGKVGRYRRVWRDPAAGPLPGSAAELRARKAATR